MCTPSLWEGFGIVFIEALACEAVVVTSDISPMNEYITNNYNGILVKDYQDPIALAEAISKACTEPALRSVIKKNARQSVGNFSKEKVDQLEKDLYERFISLWME
jgi:glycosyltransferase involved in cell wall biosynthesis